MNYNLLDFASLPISNMKCIYCKKRGITVQLSVFGSKYLCPICLSSYDNPTGDPNLIMYEEFKQNLISNRDLLWDWPKFPPHPFNNYLNMLLNNARNTIISGYYLSGILALNNYLEALIKEIIFINEGVRFNKDLGKAISRAQNKKYLRKEDFQVFDVLREIVRNPFVHGDTSKILEHIYMPIHYKENGNDSFEDLDELTHLKDCKTVYTPLTVAPELSFSIAHDTIVRTKAIDYFNLLYDFASLLSIFYFSKTYPVDDMANLVSQGISYKQLKKLHPMPYNTYPSHNAAGRVILARKGSKALEK